MESPHKDCKLDALLCVSVCVCVCVCVHGKANSRIAARWHTSVCLRHLLRRSQRLMNLK